AEPGSTKARVCWTASTLQPQASELPCRATGWPSMIVVASPSTTGKTPLCFGQTAWSVTRATGLPSTLVNADPVMTRPPLSVVSPTTIHILAVKRHPVQSPLNGWNCNPCPADIILTGRKVVRGCPNSQPERGLRALGVGSGAGSARGVREQRTGVGSRREQVRRQLPEHIRQLSEEAGHRRAAAPHHRDPAARRLVAERHQVDVLR